MTLRNNVLAILESTFAGHKDELIESATDRIMWQFENQLPDAFIANGIRYTAEADRKTEPIIEQALADRAKWASWSKTYENNLSPVDKDIGNRSGIPTGSERSE